MPSYTHFFIVPFYNHKFADGVTSDVVACSSAFEATCRAEQMARYVEYAGAVAVKARSRDGKFMGHPRIFASFGEVGSDIGDLLRKRALS